MKCLLVKRTYSLLYLWCYVAVFFNFSNSYNGVWRYTNGTDLEIRLLQKQCCGDRCILNLNYTKLDNKYCGYMCKSMHSSYYTSNNTGLSCLEDQEIRQKESKKLITISYQ